MAKAQRRLTKAGIERLVGEHVRVALEKAIVGAIGALNAAGHRFEAVGDTLIEWREPGSEHQLNIFCTIGVQYDDAAATTPSTDPAVDAFVARAQSGRDGAAARLNQLETGVANGGLYQAIENHGVEFLEACAGDLRSIDAKATVRVVEQAVAAWRQHESALDGYAALRKTLSQLDRRFWSLKESIAALYERRQKSGVDKPTVKKPPVKKASRPRQKGQRN